MALQHRGKATERGAWWDSSSLLSCYLLRQILLENERSESMCSSRGKGDDTAAFQECWSTMQALLCSVLSVDQCRLHYALLSQWHASAISCKVKKYVYYPGSQVCREGCFYFLSYHPFDLLDYTLYPQTLMSDNKRLQRHQIKGKGMENNKSHYRGNIMSYRNRNRKGFFYPMSVFTLIKKDIQALCAIFVHSTPELNVLWLVGEKW